MANSLIAWMPPSHVGKVRVRPDALVHGCDGAILFTYQNRSQLEDPVLEGRCRFCGDPLPLAVAT